MIFDLVQDFAAAVDTIPHKHARRHLLSLLERALRRDVQFINRHPTALFQCMWNTCWWYDSQEAVSHYRELADDTGAASVAPGNRPGPKLHQEMKRWLDTKSRATPGFIWVRSLRPLPDPGGTSMKGRIAIHELGVLGIAFSPDGRQLASASVDTTLRLWDVQRGSETVCLRGHESRVTSVAYFSDNVRIVSGSDDETIRVWDTTTGECLACLKGHEGWVLAVAVSPNHQQIASASSDGTVRLWNWQSGEHVCLGAHKPWARAVAFSPDGKMIASGGSDRVIHLWNADSSKLMGSLKGHEGQIYGLAFSHCGKLLVSAGGISILVWNIAKKRRKIELKGPTKAMRCVAWLPNGDKICGGSEDGTARVWDCASGKEVFRTPEDRYNWVMSVATSPYVDGLAAAYADGSVRLLDQSTTPDYQLIGHGRPINGCGFFDGGSKFVSWSIEGFTLDPTAFVWDVETGRCLGTAPGWSLIPNLETKSCRRVQARRGETQIRTKHEGPLGWVPAELAEICYNTNLRIWAGCYNKDVYLFKLEGEYKFTRT